MTWDSQLTEDEVKQLYASAYAQIEHHRQAGHSIGCSASPVRDRPPSARPLG